MKLFAGAVVAVVLCTTVCCAENNELELPSISAFSIGTDVNIKSVEEIATDSLNDVLLKAQKRNEEWTKSFVQIALRLSGAALSGTRQSVSVKIDPSEWEKGRPLNWARVTIVDEGWLDDSVSGERYVIWLVPDTDGNLTVQRILRAALCHRPYWKFYSSEPCP
ncbi:MAG: hypothetical protein JSV33_15020 [bacterium]|nr:MAG: hypothetical protein JSV33_15020 [bacterium]